MPTQADFPCMLAEKFIAKKVKSWPVAVEPKLDGVRALIVVKHVVEKDEKTGEEVPAYEVTTYSRKGNTFTSVHTVEDALLDVFAESGINTDYVFDGELICGSFKDTVSQIKKQNKEAPDAVFHVFDMIPLEHFNEKGDDREFHIRRAMLKSFFAGANLEQLKKIQVSRCALANNVDDVMRFYAQARSLGKEGVIIKELTGPISHWVGKRSRGWTKIKDRETIDLKIVGAELGVPDGKYAATLGNLICELPPDPENPNQPKTVNVGTGITDKERDDLWKMFQAGTLVGLTAELDYHERTPDGSLRHPVFKHLRIDK